MTAEEASFFEDDMSDIEAKIDYLLEKDRWRTFAERGYKAFQKKHSNIRRTEYFLSKIEDATTFLKKQEKLTFLRRLFNR